MNKETKIQRAIQNYLNGRGIWNMRVNADLNTIGVPDLIVCYKGKFIGMEVKTKKGRISGVQNKTAEAIKENGGYVINPTCVEEVIELLEIIDSRDKKC